MLSVVDADDSSSYGIIIYYKSGDGVNGKAVGR